MVGKHAIFSEIGTGQLHNEALVASLAQLWMWLKDMDVKNILSRCWDMGIFLCYSLYQYNCGGMSSQPGQLGKLV